MPDAAWKQFERQVARLLDGERWIREGSNTPDVRHPFLSPEVKYRKTDVFTKAALRDAIAQAKRNERPGKPWCVIYKTRGQSVEDALVTMSLSDFAGIIRRLPY